MVDKRSDTTSGQAAVPPTLSLQLAEHVAGFRLDDVPLHIVRKAKLVLLDTLGEALAGSRQSHPVPRGLMEFVGGSGGRGESSLVGQGRQVGSIDAAFFNAAMAAFGLTDPIHGGTTMHAPAIAAATALALSERAAASGRRLLEAFVLGIEVACRVSAALGPAALYGRGFHPTAVCGAFGAAAAGCHALGLEQSQLRAALGLAFQQASGVLAWITDSTESARPLSPALGARNGTNAALLAACGLGGPPNPFDGKYSAFVAFSGEGQPKMLLEDWGSRYYWAELSHKLHASCSYTHSALDALFVLMRERDFKPAEVQEIMVRTAPSARPLITDPDLRYCYAPYVLAVALVRGQVSICDIVADRTELPDVDRLLRRVRVSDDPDLEPGYPDRCAAVVEITLLNGTEFSQRIDAAKGTAANPLSELEIIEKYRATVDFAVPAKTASAIIDQIEQLERLKDIEALATLLRDVPA